MEYKQEGARLLARRTDSPARRAGGGSCQMAARKLTFELSSSDASRDHRDALGEQGQQAIPRIWPIRAAMHDSPGSLVISATC